MNSSSTCNRFLAATVFAVLAIQSPAGTRITPARRPAESPLSHHYANLPMAFEPNVGQTDGRVNYVARGSGYTVFLTGQEAVLRVKGTASDSVVSLKFSGASSPKTVALERQHGVTNYYDFADASRTHVNVPNYGAVRYAEVYPGVDAVIRGDQGNFRYDYVVKPGADPSAIRFAFGGTKILKSTADGALLLDNGLVQQKPYIYQEAGGGRSRAATCCWPAIRLVSGSAATTARARSSSTRR